MHFPDSVRWTRDRDSKKHRLLPALYIVGLLERASYNTSSYQLPLPPKLYDERDYVSALWFDREVVNQCTHCWAFLIFFLNPSACLFIGHGCSLLLVFFLCSLYLLFTSLSFGWCAFRLLKVSYFPLLPSFLAAD
jgi:hypothetical protein